MEYITPFVKKYSNIDDLLQNKDINSSIYDDRHELSINNLLGIDFICIVGEPGIGKSRLIKEIINQIPDKYFFMKATTFEIEYTEKEEEYYIIDALDEVAENQFFQKLQAIKKLKEFNPTSKVVFSCRKHYVASFAKAFSQIKGITFLEIDKLTNKQVEIVIDGCSDVTKMNVANNPKLKELIRIPRYLGFLLQSEKQNRSYQNMGELFDYIITNSIETAIKQSKRDINIDTFIILIEYVLQKVAFIMEICRKDNISKDELYTILDGVKGNMTQMLLANFDLLFLQSRILKDTAGMLQFENTELQEFLAAKELLRHDHIESILYDVAVNKELKHIYPNWYDVLPHISYSNTGTDILINVIKLIISYESNLENKSFESLLRYIDPSILTPLQRKDLFTIIFEHYFNTHPLVYIGTGTVDILVGCYNSSCAANLMQNHDNLNKIQLANIRVILERLRESQKLEDKIIQYWKDAVKTLIHRDDEYKVAALYICYAINDTDTFIYWMELFKDFNQHIKDTFYDVTGHSKITQIDVVNCWINGCFERNPHAINAVMFITDIPTITYVYRRIIEANKLHEFFNPIGSLHVFYEYPLVRHFEITWDKDAEYKLILSKIIATYLSEHSYTSNDQIYPLVKIILKNHDTGGLFIDCFDRFWDLEDLFRRFDVGLIDIELISSIEELMHRAKIEQRHIDAILTTLVYKIRMDDNKKDLIKDYIMRYTPIFDSWEENSKKINYEGEKPELISIYESLNNSEINKYNKFEAAFKLSKNFDFVQKVDLQPIVATIIAFFNDIDLDEVSITRQAEDSFRITASLIKIPSFINLLNHFGIKEVLLNNRDKLLKTLPIICWISNFNANEIKGTYKSLIGSITNQEQDMLVEWWKSRNDDFINISPDDIISCITDYGISTLSYKLEEYIADYVKHPNAHNSIPAAKALKLISEGYCQWDLAKYRLLFQSLNDKGIDSVKMQCNAIMIEQFQDEAAIKWRINYLRNNVFKSVQNQTGQLRPVSMEEIEVNQTNPQLFRCFMSLRANENLNKYMLELFEFGLSLSVNQITQEYSSYLLNQIYLFFISTESFYHIKLLRTIVENYNVTNQSYFVNRIMNNAEVVFLNRNKISIEKALKQYNRCIEETYLDIRNDGDLRRFFTNIYLEVQKEIQDQGIYSLVRSEDLNEDFIQRELKNTIINKCCQIGLETVQIDREVTLQDNKRTDLLIRFGLCNPIMVELKLLNNEEIQNDEKRREYKGKFVQYLNATNASLAVFWIFDVHKKKNNDRAKFDILKSEYMDLPLTKVILSDCKCSSSMETGISKPRKQSKQSKKASKGKK